MRKVVAKRIKLARVARDWKQSDLAERLGVGQQQVAVWESGEINIGVDTLERIAAVFDLPPSDFLIPLPPIRSEGAPAGRADNETVPRRRREDWLDQYEKAAAADEHFHDSERQADNQAARRAA